MIVTSDNQFAIMLLKLVLVVLSFLENVRSEEPIVEIHQGVLRGVSLTNRDGGRFYGFQNIPYAQPPVKELRFKPPIPADGWEGIRDASADVPSCTQYILAVHPSTFGQEDCLYLNVFTPEIPSQNTTKKPVMVFIHGGAFIWGSATVYLYGPEFLMTKDIVLVTLNYRLGIFGALSIDDPDLGVPGNIGLRDQVLALRWVAENIERFGGDRDNVLIFGDSAGSMSVHFHLLSPMSVGLFDKVIGQSGTGIVTVLGARNSGIMVAEQLGIQTDNLTLTLRTLQKLPVEEVSDATQLIAEKDDNIFFTSPIVEIPTKEQPFLVKQPIDTLIAGNYTPVPYLTGFNNLEGLLWEKLMLEMTGESMLIEDFTQFVPSDLQIAPGSEEESALAQRIKEFYYGDSEPSRDNILPAVDLWGDFIFCFPAYRAVVEHARRSESIFLYYLSLDTQLNFIKTLVPQFRQFPGAAHGDERGYLFQTVLAPSVIHDGSAEDIGIRTMVELWTNFAIYGHPTPENSTFKWKPVRDGKVNFLHLGTNATYPDVNPREKNMAFWSSIYEEYFPRY